MMGCLVHVISQVAWGRLHRSFMPDSSSFSMWDDLAVPLGLGISVTVVSWGPTIVLILALVLGVFSAAPPSALQLAEGPDQRHAPIDQEKLGVLLDPNGDPKKQEAAAKELDRLRPGLSSVKKLTAPKRNSTIPPPTCGSSWALLLVRFCLWGSYY
jgi:hypothetical protein